MPIKNVCAAFLQSSNSITRNNDKFRKDKYLNDFVIILESIRDFSDSHSLSSKNKSITSFFNERLTMVNINAFYFMCKNNYSYKELKNYRATLKMKNLFFIKHRVAIKKKEYFRKFILNNFFAFVIIQPLKKYIN